LRGPQADLFESLFRFRPSSRLEVFRRAGELGVEVRCRRGLTDVALEKSARKKNDRECKRESGERVIGYSGDETSVNPS
jgi:hypothetical protein